MAMRPTTEVVDGPGAQSDTAPGDRVSGMQATAGRRDPARGHDPCAEIPIMRELGLLRGTMVGDTYRIVRPLGA